MNYKIKLLVIQMLLFAQSFGQFPILLKDIAEGGNSNPSQFTEFLGKTFFTATNAIVGTEIFVTDGTENGTSLFLDIYPNINNSNPGNFIVYKGMLYFTATSPVSGNELWVTDGSAGGTMIFKDINPGISSSNITGIKILNNQLIFNAFTPSNGNELWTSDGTVGGTFMLKDIYIGVNSSSPFNFYPYKNKLFFTAANGTTGSELWYTDGSASGTQMVKDIRPGTLQSNATSFFEHNGLLYFSANDGINGQELWQTDSTSAGTFMLKNIFTGAGNSNPSNFVSFKGKLFFTAISQTAGQEVWMSDGSAAGTQMLKDIRVGTIGSNATNLFVYKNLLFFSANDSALGNELWYSDSTISGTKLFRDLNPGFASSTPNSYLIFNEEMYFFANTTTGTELYKLNPTLDTLSQLMPIGNSPLNPAHLCNTLRLCNQSIYYNGNYTIEGGEPYILNFQSRLFSSKPSNTYYAYIDSLSPVQSIFINGFSLIDSVRIRMPANYEIATNLNGPFSNATTLTINLDKSIAQLVYTRFKPNLAGATFNQLKISSLGIDTITIPLIGFGISIPILIQSNALLDTFKTFVDSISTAQSIYVSAKKLNDHLTVKVKGNFKVSTDSLTGFSDSLTLLRIGDSLSNTQLFLRYFPKNKGYEEGQVEFNSFGLSSANRILRGNASIKPYFKIDLFPGDTFKSMIQQHSSPQNFEISGEEIKGFIEIKANSFFEISNDSVDYASSIKIYPTGMTLIKTKIYIRYSPLSLGTHQGEISIHATNINSEKYDVVGKSTPIISSISNYTKNIVRIYPNPFTEKIVLQTKLQMEIDYSYTMLNAQGQIVLQKSQNKDDTEINVSSLESGIYFLTISSEDFQHTIKLIKN
ncbi:MAG: T9SS type A sorting domain-containing protein [Chitinophagales bacterium]|nr:T9SS type A sorting domain-containing protein [Chitinophagales bacterium]